MNPRTVVIVGASADPTKFGYKAVRAHQQRGWRVIPVNPRGGQIAGAPVCTRLEDVAGPVDRVTLYVPPGVGVTLLSAIAALSPAELYVNPGADSPELLDAARALGLDPLVACSIVAVGVRPEDVSSE